MQRNAAAASRATNFKIPTTATLYKRRRTRWPPQTPHAPRYQVMRSLAQVPECWDTIYVPLVPWCSNHKDFQGYCRAGGKSTQTSSPSSLYNLCSAWWPAQTPCPLHVLQKAKLSPLLPAACCLLVERCSCRRWMEIYPC